VVVTVTVPKVVRITPPRDKGGPIAKLEITVTIKNTGPWPIPFGRHNLVNACFSLDPGELDPQVPRIMRPWQHQLMFADDGAKVVEHHGMQRDNFLSIGFVVLPAGDQFSCLQIQVFQVRLSHR
jgi:hypothetical protein